MRIMPERRILLLGDPLLWKVSQPVADPRSATTLMQDLEDTLAAFRRSHGFGRGISAVQVGELSRVIFMLVDGVRYEMVNPKMVWHSDDTFSLWDDCFSFPHLMVWLERWRAVQVRYITPTGEMREFDAEGALAELVQHELDHLDGVLAVDRARNARCLSLRDEVMRLGSVPPHRGF